MTSEGTKEASMWCWTGTGCPRGDPWRIPTVTCRCAAFPVLGRRSSSSQAYGSVGVSSTSVMSTHHGTPRSNPGFRPAVESCRSSTPTVLGRRGCSDNPSKASTHNARGEERMFERWMDSVVDSLPLSPAPAALDASRRLTAASIDAGLAFARYGDAMA